MIRFLFWNVCGVASIQERTRGSGTRPLLPTERRYRRLQRILKLIAARNQLDVLVLAESPFEGNAGIPGFIEAKHTLLPNRNTRTRLEIYHRDTVAFTGFQTLERAVLLQMNLVASKQNLLLVTAHLNSPLHISSETRKDKVKEFAEDIRDQETKLGHTRTILLGDLNYDPQDAAITDVRYLNAVASKTVARQQVRQANRSSLLYFYNPMWTHLSDVVGEVPGTYYRKTKDVDCRFWYLPDQVLLRPSLLDYWKDDELKILTRTGRISLLDRKKRPDRKRFSDHLPLVFTLGMG